MFERYRAASVPTPPPPVGLVESQRELRDIQDAVSHAQKQMSRLINTLEKQPPHIPDLENADVAAKTTVVIEKKTVLGVEDRSSVLHFALETFDTEETSRLLALLRRLQELQHNAQEPSEHSGTPSPDSGARHSPATDRQPAGNP